MSALATVMMQYMHLSMHVEREQSEICELSLKKESEVKPTSVRFETLGAVDGLDISSSLGSPRDGTRDGGSCWPGSDRDGTEYISYLYDRDATASTIMTVQPLNQPDVFL